jgi:hypothetical protein
LSLPTTFFAVFGLVSMLQKLPGFRNNKSPEGLHREAATAKLLEIDLRSTSPVVLMRSMANPQFSVWLRFTNHASYALRVTHLTVDVWFGQPTVELVLDRPFAIEAYSTKDDVGLRDIPDRSKVEYIEDFLAGDDPAKTLYLDVNVACESSGGPIEKFVHIERRPPELSTIIR